MFTAILFKIVVDSRQATLGTSINFQVQLPETLHLDIDVVLYVNSATVTNTFLSTGTTVGSRSHYVYFYEKNGPHWLSTEPSSRSAATWQMSLLMHWRAQ